MPHLVEIKKKKREEDWRYVGSARFRNDRRRKEFRQKPSGQCNWRKGDDNIGIFDNVAYFASVYYLSRK